MSPRGALVLVAAAGLLLTVSTGAFTSVDANRGVELAVASDENAYLGYEADFSDNNGTLANGTITVANQVGVSNLEVTVTVQGRTNTTTLDTGESETFGYENVSCGADVSVTAQDGVHIDLARSVDC